MFQKICAKLIACKKYHWKAWIVRFFFWCNVYSQRLTSTKLNEWEVLILFSSEMASSRILINKFSSLIFFWRWKKDCEVEDVHKGRYPMKEKRSNWKSEDYRKYRWRMFWVREQNHCKEAFHVYCIKRTSACRILKLDLELEPLWVLRFSW